jgi:hypothetical protein
MKLCKFHLPGKGTSVRVVDGDDVVDVLSTRADATSVLACGTAEKIESRLRPLMG